MGKPVTGVVSFDRHQEGWTVTLEVVELERIPETTSILGAYEVTLGQSGDLEGYRRLRRYARSQIDEG